MSSPSAGLVHSAGRYSPYDAGFGALCVVSLLALVVLLARRPRGQRRPSGPLAEGLLIVAVLTGVMAVLHQTVTDGLCHGACF